MRPSHAGLSRRQFVKSAALAAGAAAMTPAALAGRAWHPGRAGLRLGVIGSGDRGSGAVINAMEADPGVRLVAMADLFPDRLEKSLANLAGHPQFGARVKPSEVERFAGFDAYARLLKTDVDVVILATPPHFRPEHFGAAVEAGKHVFMEKPVAVDPPGVRRVLAAAEVADRKGLSIAAGTQRRHDPKYRELVRRVQDGQIGPLLSGRCWWNQGGLWVHKRKPEYSDMEWQCRNWLYFCWLSGDHIVEQHVHNLDVMNWALAATPQRCVAMGGRQVRTGPEYGNIFDHFAVEYEYPGGVSVHSYARQIDGCASRVDEQARGAAGLVSFGDGRILGPRPYAYEGPSVNPYVQEHADLFASIRGESGSPRLNEARNVAHSTLTAIMGRLSAYTGQEVTWEQALASPWRLGPSVYELGALETDPVPVPGRTRLPEPSEAKS
jgi:predicted dehydrogenase